MPGFNQNISNISYSSQLHLVYVLCLVVLEAMKMIVSKISSEVPKDYGILDICF